MELLSCQLKHLWNRRSWAPGGLRLPGEAIENTGATMPPLPFLLAPPPPGHLEGREQNKRAGSPLLLMAGIALKSQAATHFSPAEGKTYHRS